MHLTDEELNEYLDNEIQDRTSIELHLSSCNECAARLATLQALFTEIGSLPELELTRPIAARFAHSPGLPAQLPRWLTLTATLQGVLALVAIILAAPVVMDLFPVIQTPSLTDAFVQIQTQWTAWLGILSNFQLPSVPEIPVFEFSSLILALILMGVSMFWLVGNGLLLRNQIK